MPTFEQIKAHYELEKSLATQLRQASKAERRHLYASLYDDLFRQVPYLKTSTNALFAKSQVRFLRRFLSKDTTLAEIGAGDCALSLEAARFVKQVFAIDVTNEIT